MLVWFIHWPRLLCIDYVYYHLQGTQHVLCVCHPSIGRVVDDDVKLQATLKAADNHKASE